MLLPGELLIHEGNWQSQVLPVVNGETKMHGLNPRNFKTHPCGSIPGIPAASIPKIPRSEWPRMIKELRDARALFSDIRMTTGPNGGMIPSRDQNGKGYCWAHSSVSAVIATRAIAGLPYADLSAYAIACMIKRFRDEGGWNAESIQFFRDKGCPTSATWPQQSMSRSNDNPKTWEEAAKYKITETQDVGDRDFDMLMTLLIMGFVGPIDENWWSHSIAAVDPVDGTASFGACRNEESGKLMDRAEFDRVWETEVGGGFGVRIWNSWGDSWSTNGMGVLTESKATPDGCIMVRVTNATSVV